MDLVCFLRWFGCQAAAAGGLAWRWPSCWCSAVCVLARWQFRDVVGALLLQCLTWGCSQLPMCSGFSEGGESLARLWADDDDASGSRTLPWKHRRSTLLCIVFPLFD